MGAMLTGLPSSWIARNARENVSRLDRFVVVDEVGAHGAHVVLGDVLHLRLGNVVDVALVAVELAEDLANLSAGEHASVTLGAVK